MTARLYTLEEYAEIIDQDWRIFYTSRRLAVSLEPDLAEPMTLDQWDQEFDDYTAESRQRRGVE